MKNKRVCKKKPVAYKGLGFSGSKQKSSSTSQSKTTAIDPKLLGSTSGILSDIRGFLPSIAGSVGDVPSDDELFQTASRRLLQSSRSGMAGRGLLTSGAGQEVEDRLLGGLATQFGERAFERELGRAGFEREGAIAASSSLLDALRSILGQTTVGESTGVSTGKGKSLGFSIGG